MTRSLSRGLAPAAPRRPTAALPFPHPVARALGALALVAVVLLALACSGAGGDAAPGTAASASADGTGAAASDSAPASGTADEPCTAPASWFPHDQTPKPNDEAVFATNCDFHQWSVQMFLWLTQTMPDGQLRFETFARPAALFPPVGTEPPPYQEAAGGDAVLDPRVTKSDDPTLLDEVNQAGSLGLLVDPSGRAVYYSMYVNDVFYEFVRQNGLYDPQTLYDASDTLDFPVGALELKASWKILDGTESGDEGWYTRTMTIAELSQDETNVVVDPTKTEKVEVALVGLHVAGVVNQHPEFIWATFGHRDNAPTLTDSQLDAYLDASDMSINNQPVSDESFTFYRAGTTFVHSNQNNAGLLELTDPQAQTLTPITDAFTQYAQGGGDADNRENVETLDESTRKQLDDSFATYEYGGAIWLAANDGLVPNSTQQDLITGSIALSNVTMETFTQKVLDQRNCFGCHNTMQRFPPEPGTGVKPLPGKNLNVSHILVNHYFQASQRLLRSSGGDETDSDAN